MKRDVKRHQLTPLLIAGLLAMDVPAPAIEPSPRPDRKGDVAELVDRVVAYVERFHHEMEGAVLEERYVQLLRKPCCIEPRSPGDDPNLRWNEPGGRGRQKGVVEQRQLLSELLLVPVSGGMKIGYRDVLEVDGRPVKARDERMRRLFEEGTTASEVELGKIAAESTRFNLGPLRRTANIPSMPLLYLVPSARERLYFSSGGRERRDGREVAVLEFREDDSPTLVADAAGRDMPARGRIWVDAETGAIREVELRIGERARRVLRVWFRDESRMKVLVPIRMWEWYERIQVSGETWPVDLEAMATYSNVRLFTVSTTEGAGEAIP